MNDVLKRVKNLGIIPVVKLDDAKDAIPLAKALCEGGLPVAEVTFRTDAAEESIRLMAENFPDMLIGAGTVLTTEQVDRAVAAGAKFIVSPGLNPRIVKYCVEKGIVITTFYLAKGLEFDSVHIAYAPEEEKLTEYQRQILYIGATRALHELTIYSFADK